MAVLRFGVLNPPKNGPKNDRTLEFGDILRHPFFSESAMSFSPPTRIPPRLMRGNKTTSTPLDPRNPALPGVLLDFCELQLGVGQESRWSRSTFDATPWGCQGVGESWKTLDVLPFFNSHLILASWKKINPTVTRHCHLNKKTPANKLPLFLCVWKFHPKDAKMPTDQKVFILDQESLTPMPDANQEVTGMLGVAGPQVLDEGMVDEGTMDGWMSVFPGIFWVVSLMCLFLLVEGRGERNFSSKG